MKIRSTNRKGQRSITGRLTGAVLIPSVTLLVMWLAVSAYLLYDGFYSRAVAASVREVSIPAVNGLASAARERQLSMAYLGQPSLGLRDLHAQEQQTDQGLAEMKAAASDALSNAPQQIVTGFNTLNSYLAQLPAIRAQVDAETIGVKQVYSFYNSLLDAAISLFGTQARVEPDATASQGGVEATSLFQATDLMARAGSLISTGLVTGSLPQADHIAFTGLVGSYHGELDKTAPFLEPDVADSYRQLQSTPAWRDLVTAENGFVEHGPWTSVDGSLPATATDWQNLTDQVAAQLTTLSKQQADEVSAQALDKGNTTFVGVVIGSLVALLAAITAIVVARRVSRTLVDRTLVTRLARLRDEALELARRRLPDIVTRLRAGERVDVQAELPDLHFGSDEIGEVADAFNAAQSAAVAATVQQAQAREGVHNVFLGIAHRDQGLVHRLLKLLDVMEREEEEPGRLERLFQLDHLATRARRNAENLIILGGELPGRRWRRPVPLIDVLRAGVAETEQYRRVRVEHVPDVSIAGTAVADVIHLVAELVDNATAFSPPRSQVHVNATQVAKGAVIEVEDQGLGMTDEDRERANATMAAPPDFDAMAARGDSRLGLFVIARLASRNGIDVEFRISPYGGTRAIVLVPARVLAEAEDGTDERSGSVNRRDLVTAGAGRRAGVRVPRQAGGLGPDEYFEPGRTPQNGAQQASSARQTGFVEPQTLRAARTAGLAEVADDPEATVVRPVRRSVETPARWPEREEDVVDQHAVDQPAADQPVTSQPVPADPNRFRLPQRRPQAHLVPQLREDSDEQAQETPELHVDDIGSAEGVRSRISAYQRGSREGREAGEDFDGFDK